MSIVKVAYDIRAQICLFEHVYLFHKILQWSVVSQPEVWQLYQLIGQGQMHKHTQLKTDTSRHTHRPSAEKQVSGFGPFCKNRGKCVSLQCHICGDLCMSVSTISVFS